MNQAPQQAEAGQVTVHAGFLLQAVTQQRDQAQHSAAIAGAKAAELFQANQQLTARVAELEAEVAELKAKPAAKTAKK